MFDHMTLEYVGGPRDGLIEQFPYLVADVRVLTPRGTEHLYMRDGDALWYIGEQSETPYIALPNPLYRLIDDA